MSCYYDYRKYISERVKAICPKMKAHKKAFDREAAVTGEHFHILPISIFSSYLSHSGNAIRDELSVSLQLYFNEKRDEQKALDQAIQKAHCIRASLIKSENIDQNSELKKVSVTSLTPIDSFDSSNIINLEITLEIHLCLDCCNNP